MTKNKLNFIEAYRANDCFGIDQSKSVGRRN